MVFITRVLWASYLLLMLKPSVPILVDKIAHNVWESEHHRLIHELYGADHVEQEVKKAGDDSENNKSSSKIKVSEEQVAHTLSILPEISILSFRHAKPSFPLLLLYFPLAHCATDVPPPWHPFLS